jgi:hypothetical protein
VTDIRCTLTDLYVSQCAHCRGLGNVPRDDLGPWFTASYPGRCVGCDDAIHPGHRIRSKGADGYLCDACGGGVWF